MNIQLDGKVFLSDTDAVGIVHHSRYLIWAENARCNFLNAMGFSVKRLEKINDHGIALPVIKSTTNYFSPLVLDDEFAVTIDECKIKGSLIKINSSLYKYATTSSTSNNILAPDAEPAATSITTLSCVNLKTLTTCEIPPQIIAAISTS